MIPNRLTGRQFEAIIVERLAMEKDAGVASIGRYGVQASVMEVKGKREVILHQSLPDFEGVLIGGRQVIFDAKVCSQASFGLAKYRLGERNNRSRQLSHMLDRSAFGAVCFFLILWSERHLKTKHEPSATFAFPVSRSIPVWQWFMAGNLKSLTREHCQTYGVHVEWTTTDRGRKYRPDVVAACEALSPTH